MTDAIGHPLVIGDYVTAVWTNGEVSLFEVAGFDENARCGGRRRYRVDIIKLKRVVKEEYMSDELFKKLVKKETTQVTWVDPDYVFMYFLTK